MILIVLVVIHILMCISALILVKSKDNTAEDKRLIRAMLILPYLGPAFLMYIWFQGSMYGKDDNSKPIV